jgi:acyl-CoA thioesterase-1
VRHSRLSSVFTTLTIAMLASACASRPDADSRSSNASSAVNSEESPFARRESTGRPRVVVLGDSLTAGLGLRPEQAFPTLLQNRIDAEALNYEVVNAGVSGDTTAGGLSRLDWALQGDVRVLIVALGGNDGLRGLPPEEVSSNLSKIIERGQSRGATVILAGMEAPPNFGRAYSVSFHKVYPELAERYGIALVPFLLDGVAGIAALNQQDGIHPTADGDRMVADNVWTVLEPALKKLSPRK